MRKRPRRQPVQLELFCRRSALPPWRTLPLEVRQQVHALIVQLLKAHRAKCRVRQDGKRVIGE